MSMSFSFIPRLKAATMHLALSAVVALGTAALVFGLWYPWPYSLVSGGRDLFILILAVDLILGPLLTFVVFNHMKTRAHLTRDIVVIIFVQLLALGYGVYTMALARPVAVVFEVDRFRVVSQADVLIDELNRAPVGLQSLSLTGPRIVGTRKVETGEEKIKAIELALKGFDIGVRPSYWQPYQKSVDAVLAKARPLVDLYKRYPERTVEIDRALATVGRRADELKFLPLVGRERDWSVLIDRHDGQLMTFIPLDGFF